MLKKRLWLVIYTALLAFLSVFIFFKIQERDLIIQLNNHNLSLDAYHVVLKKPLTIEEFENKIDQDQKLPSLQIHFQSPKKNTTYFFGTGDFAAPPMISGSFFPAGDFKSDVSVMVVGKDWKNKLYTPKDQSYLKRHGHYYPVLGIMGDKYRSDLDRQLFILPSTSARKKLLANHFRIIVDGKQKLTSSQLKAALPLDKISRLKSKKLFVSQGSWTVAHWAEVLGLLVVVIGFILGTVLWRLLARQRYHEARFLQKTSQTFIFEEWCYYALFSGVGLIFGLIAGMIIFNMYDYLLLLLFVGSIFIVANLYLIIRLNSLVKREV
ncbi:hypothetical protein FC89_GL002025 [Liquorilactobacillus ghanensis DSM 18630]|uniref:MacB-like periplasmic core domain-containing protein n=1 Tax=Liquorilactobacillus ghanensis DSM 18630 TaxID=1423750 RepID=A0A0R1W0W0_9LACO|nr:ABC transporter permease [Liquorilactobacillus ghanensis]KRM07916.1 hypothetical protein FC89_GL002025 [Liquorilactobacillus ghanensis DSM 18630]